MSLGTLGEFVSSNLGTVLLVVAVFSCVVSIPLWTAIYRRLRAGIPREGRRLSLKGVPRSREVKKVSALSVRAVSGSESNLFESLMETRRSDPERPVRVEFSEGDFRLPTPLKLLEHLRLEGISVGTSVLRSASSVPGLRFECVRDCLVKGFTIQGGFRCSQGDVTIRDCIVQNGESQAGIEATEGATVTFSGTIVPRHGGVAIRAAGKSRVILERPYQIDDDDRVFLEPGCEIVF